MSSSTIISVPKPRPLVQRGWTFTTNWRGMVPSVLSLAAALKTAKPAQSESVALVCVSALLLGSAYIALRSWKEHNSPLNIDAAVRWLRCVFISGSVDLICAVSLPHFRQFAFHYSIAFVFLLSLEARFTRSPDFARTPMFRVGCSRQSQAYARLKHAADGIGALLLLFLLSPLLILIAVLIKLDSTGPVLFSHQRIGERGRRFRILKFRSMYSGTPSYQRSPSQGDDPRITRVGRVLRRLGLDELPQLINVVRGEMSFVGPRPEMPFIVNSYTRKQRGRLYARPGITGLWQISPARALPIHENLQYDLYYIAHRSLLLDVAILCRTVSAVVRGIGAI